MFHRDHILRALEGYCRDTDWPLRLCHMVHRVSKQFNRDACFRDIPWATHRWGDSAFSRMNVCKHSDVNGMATSSLWLWKERDGAKQMIWFWCCTCDVKMVKPTGMLLHEWFLGDTILVGWRGVERYLRKGMKCIWNSKEWQWNGGKWKALKCDPVVMHSFEAKFSCTHALCWCSRLHDLRIFLVDAMTSQHHTDRCGARFTHDAMHGDKAQQRSN